MAQQFSEKNKTKEKQNQKWKKVMLRQFVALENETQLPTFARNIPPWKYVVIYLTFLVFLTFLEKFAKLKKSRNK